VFVPDVGDMFVVNVCVLDIGFAALFGDARLLGLERQMHTVLTLIWR